MPDLENTVVTYARGTTADTIGNYTLRVAHPGEYEIEDRTITVPES